MGRRFVFSSVVLGLLLALSPAHAEEQVIPTSEWHLIKSESGPTNYFTPMNEGGVSFIRAQYVPPMKTSVLGFQIPDGDRKRIQKVRWTWRALTLPEGGDECVPAKADSAAVVYVTWKRGLRYYTLKYVWSSVGKKGAICDSKRNLFVAQDTVIVESGGPLNVWKSVEVDLAQHFRHHFANDDPKASVPDLVGLGIMSDGDQTNSPSSADFGQFVLTK